MDERPARGVRAEDTGGAGAGSGETPDRGGMVTTTQCDRRRWLAIFIFLSGACALVYQVVWLREFRLIFGAATPATAAVLALFMGGLGLGSTWLGRRAERGGNLLRLYALLEGGIGLGALVTPWLLQAVRALYLRTGGVVTLGPWMATPVQLLLSAVVLGVPCILMGGTLPVAVKCLGSDDDEQRGGAGLLYGLNALGALTGVVLSTFWLMELWGMRGTLVAAASLNLVLAGVAIGIARRTSSEPGPRGSIPARAEVPAARGPTATGHAPSAFVHVAACLTGFGFFLGELVWYRMSAPLMGSSTYNFGLILALALAGIGLGGLAYRALVAPRAGRVSATFFGMLTAAQACAFILPHALGDRMAVVALHAGQLRSLGFGGQVAGWTVIAALLVFLPSLLAGVQFPVLVALVGRGRDRVGRQVGTTYAANTVGAIAGCLLGGFLLIPGLSAPGCWRLVTGMSLGLAAVALAIDRRRGQRGLRVLAVSLLVAGTGLLVFPVGPTASWRHSPIGYGRIEQFPEHPDQLRNYFAEQRRTLLQEFDGRESSVGVVASSDYAFFVNGKSDGSALGDAATQVMAGLVGAALHPGVRQACVIGLGTGSSAGWLSAVPGVERVDVVELEPGMIDLARTIFAPVNQDVTRRPNVHLIVGDAREALMVRGPSYDLVFSEPSNPYRAGIASLYTREYYEAVRRRLNPGGLFCQWVQGYEVDAPTIRVVYATLASVFPYVETWVTKPGDLLFVGHLQAPAYRLEDLRRRLATEPFKEALTRTWQVDTLEGFMARHYAGPGVAKAIAAQQTAVNTDDRNLLEYGFARALHRKEAFTSTEILRVAAHEKMDLPAHLVGQLDPTRVREERLLMYASVDEPFELPPELAGDERSRALAISASTQGNPAAVLQLWRGEARSMMSRLLLAEAVGRAGTPQQGRLLLGAIELTWPAEARLSAARLAARHGSPAGAVEHLRTAFSTLQGSPWLRERIVDDGLKLAVELGHTNAAAAAALFAALGKPFQMGALEERRRETRLELSRQLPPADQVAAIDAHLPHMPWTRSFLEQRVKAYAAAQDPRIVEARADLSRFLAEAGVPFAESVLGSPQTR